MSDAEPLKASDLALTHPASELRNVVNDAGQIIGHVHELLIRDDQIHFAVLSVGGFLGIGTHQVVAPFHDLLPDGDVLILPGATAATLKAMLVYNRADARGDHSELRRARRGVKDAGQIVKSGAGEPLLGTIADITDGGR